MKTKEIDNIFNFGILPEPNPYGTTLTVKKHNQLLRKMKLETEAYASTLRQSVLEEVREKIEERERLLRLILPMAKGYAFEHNVGRNQEYVDQVTSLINNLIEEK